MRYLRAFYVGEKINKKLIDRLELAPVTIFCGSNCSGKTTLLNFICQNLFNEYLDITDSDTADAEQYSDFTNNYGIHDSGQPDESFIDWDSMDKDLHTENIHAVFDTDENGAPVLPLNTLIERNYDLLLCINDIDYYYYYYDDDCDFSTSECIEKLRSNFIYYNLCILDMPEMGLSIDAEQKLVRFIEESAYLYGVQFIIATKSPVIASIKEALIYDMDAKQIQPIALSEVNIVKQYKEFFNKQ